MNYFFYESSFYEYWEFGKVIKRRGESVVYSLIVHSRLKGNFSNQTANITWLVFDTEIDGLKYLWLRGLI